MATPAAMMSALSGIQVLSNGIVIIGHGGKLLQHGIYIFLMDDEILHFGGIIDLRLLEHGRHGRHRASADPPFHILHTVHQFCVAEKVKAVLLQLRQSPGRGGIELLGTAYTAG